MQELNILTKKKIKEILFLIKKQFGASVGLDYAFLQNEKGRIYLINKEISKISLDNIRINSIGLYFGEVRNNEIRLSIEGSQLVGSFAKKNILELNSEQVKEWMAGQDLEIDPKLSGFVLVKYKNDFLGCGKVRDKKVFNYVGKARRVNL